jgi:hypothetical protein
VQDQELEGDGALLAHRRRIDETIDLHLADELAVGLDEPIRRADQSAAIGDHAGLDGAIERELPIDEHRGRVRAEDAGGVELESDHRLVVDRTRRAAGLGHHGPERLSLVDGEHRERSARPTERIQQVGGHGERSSRRVDGRCGAGAGRRWSAATSSACVGIAERPSSPWHEQNAARFA